MPQHQLHGLRGTPFALKYKSLYQELKDDIKADVLAIKQATGKFTIRDFGGLCMKYRVPATVMDGWLEWVFPFKDFQDNGFRWYAGTWERARNRGVKAKDIGVVWDD